MGPNDFATVGFIKQQFEGVLSQLSKLQTQLEEASPKLEKFYSIKKIAEFTEYSDQTILKWIKEGKKAPDGRSKIKLPYSELAPGEYRILWSDVIAFGKVGQIELPAHMRIAM